MSLCSSASNVRCKMQAFWQRQDGVGIMKVLKLGGNAKLKHNAADGVALVDHVCLPPGKHGDRKVALCI